MTFSTTKSEGAFVRPSEPTPSGTLLLSSIDQAGPPGFFMKSLHVFEHGLEPAKVIRKALSKALVHYYPMAGRLVRSEQGGEMEVACTGDGLWFVEARADCSLEDVNRLEQYPPLIPMEQLLPSPPDTSAGLIAMMQVTQFTCSGFIVCFMSDHMISDGLGTSQFLNAIAEMARGLQAPTVEPVWCREVIPNPPRPRQGPPPTIPTDGMYQYFSMDIDLDRISQLKDQYLEQTGRICSTFDVLCAVIWQCRTRSINLDPDHLVHISFPANARRYLLNSGHPSTTGLGYYGNCIYPLKADAPSGKIVDASTVEIVDLIRGAKERMPIELANWAKGHEEEDPFKFRFEYETLLVVDWTRLGFNEVDYGWGKPAYITPSTSDGSFSSCIYVKSPAPKKGVRFITQCVKEEHFAVYQDQMMKFAA